jgi:hypothetical protein
MPNITPSILLFVHLLSLVAFIRLPCKQASGFLMGIIVGVKITLGFLELVDEARERIGAIFVFLLSGIFGE